MARKRKSAKDARLATLAARTKVQKAELLEQLIKNIQIGNTTSIIFWLKNHHADYNDRIIHEHEHEHHLELTKEEKGSIAQALRNIGLASILKMNDDPRTVEEWEADNKSIEEERKKEIGLSKEAKKKPDKKTLGELLEEEEPETEA